MRRRHQRLGDLVGEGLLLGSGERIAVNRIGQDIQLVRLGTDGRAQAELVPPDDRAELTGWIRAAERMWNLRGLLWRFESLQEQRARWSTE